MAVRWSISIGIYGETKCRQVSRAGIVFNPLMMLALSDKGGSKDKLLPLLMMQGQQGAGGFNPMMMLALGDGELDLTTLALMGGFNGQGGLFGGAPAAPKTVQGTDAE